MPRQNAGKLSYASAGVGNQTQLLAEVFKSKTGTDLVHIPYKSGGDMVTAILSEQVEMAFPDVSIMLPLLREKKLKALAVTSPRRHPELPDVPTMIESGIPDFVMTFWSGVLAPAGTPAPIVARLNAVIAKGLQEADVKATVARIGAETRPGSIDEFRRFIEAGVAQVAGRRPGRRTGEAVGRSTSLHACSPTATPRTCPAAARLLRLDPGRLHSSAIRRACSAT